MSEIFKNCSSIEQETILYKKRKSDGELAVQRLMSELRLNSIQNNLPREVNKSIEVAFEKVTASIMRGWWITAREYCDEVAVGGYVTQELKDRIVSTIDTYITKNY